MNQNTFATLQEEHLVLPYIQKWGRAPSIAIFDSTMKIFQAPGIDGIMGYKDEAGCVLVFGDPLCDPHNMPLLVAKFHAHFLAQKKSIMYLLASDHFKKWASEHGYIKTALSMGDEIIVNPQVDPLSLRGKHASSLRNIASILQKHNLQFHEYRGIDNQLEHSMEALGQSWLQERKGPQTSLMNVNIFSHRANKRFFYVKNNDNFIGALILNRLDIFNGWTINALFYAPDAPKYTSEYILLQTLAVLRAEGCNYFSFGTLPVAQLRTIEGLGRCATFLAPYCFNLTKKILKLYKRKQYWQKFAPTIVPSYLLVHKAGIGVKEILGILRAFNVTVS